MKKTPTPSDLKNYLYHLVDLFKLPYPAITDTLGLDDSKVYVGATLDSVFIEVPDDGTDINIKVRPDGTHTVTGTLRGGVRLNKVFPYKPADFGYTRGTQGMITSYISDNLPALPIYRVVGADGLQEFKKLEDLTRVYKPMGVASSTSLRQELRGQPMFRDLTGPMFDGRKGNTVVIRYETKDAYGLHTAGEKSAIRMPPLPRDFYLPPNVRNQAPIQPEGTDLAIWSWTNVAGKPEAIAFAAKQQKPLWHYTFRDESQRQRQIDQTVEDRKKSLKFKQDRLDERKNYQHDMKEGDILYSSWGYDQTNVDFYQVVAVSGKQVSIREIASKVVKEYQGGEEVVAVPNRFVGPIMKKIPTKGYQGKASIRLNSFSFASPWDGRPRHQSGAWGR